MILDLEAIKAREAAATAGPWERGDVWLWAGVLPGVYGNERCGLCERCGPAVWVGRSDINGKKMLAHKHRNPEPWEPEHHISGPDGTVAGDVGISSPTDLAFICGARSDVPELVAEIERLRQMVALLMLVAPKRSDSHDMLCESEWESGAMAYTPCGCQQRAGG